MKLQLLLIGLVCLFNSVQAQYSDSTSYKTVDTKAIQDIELKTFEILYQNKWFENDEAVRLSVYQNKDEIVVYTDDQLIDMMQKIPTKFDLSYNQVIKQYIEGYSQNRRKLISQSLGLGTYYFPIFEEVLRKYNLPLELKYLPITESNLNPFVKSGSGAAGVWQFMYQTAKGLGLEINDYYDERRDVLKSTDTAAKYLSNLYKIYGDWQLTLAAYNAGPGNVNKAIGMAGGSKNYWEIRPYLPTETRSYISKFIACMFVMHYHEAYNILPENPNQDFFKTTDFVITDKVSLRYICELTGIDSTYLQFMNPALISGIIPKSDKGYTLHMPINFAASFASIKNFLSTDPYVNTVQAEVVKEVEVVKPKFISYKVKSGDTLIGIASKNKCTVSDLKKWNSLKSDNLKIGQVLKIMN